MEANELAVHSAAGGPRARHLCAVRRDVRDVGHVVEQPLDAELMAHGVYATPFDLILFGRMRSGSGSR